MNENGKTLLFEIRLLWNAGSRASPDAFRFAKALQSAMMPPLGYPDTPPPGRLPISAFWKRQFSADPWALESREPRKSSVLVNSWVNAEYPARAESDGRNRYFAARTPQFAAVSRSIRALSEGFSSRAVASSCF